ncbi:unnamed protein product, partial [Amoebophrya sp. A25]
RPSACCLLSAPDENYSKNLAWALSWTSEGRWRESERNPGARDIAAHPSVVSGAGRRFFQFIRTVLLKTRTPLQHATPLAPTLQLSRRRPGQEFSCLTNKVPKIPLIFLRAVFVRLFKMGLAMLLK